MKNNTLLREVSRSTQLVLATFLLVLATFLLWVLIEGFQWNYVLEWPNWGYLLVLAISAFALLLVRQALLFICRRDITCTTR